MTITTTAAESAPRAARVPSPRAPHERERRRGAAAPAEPAPAEQPPAAAPRRARGGRALDAVPGVRAVPAAPAPRGPVPWGAGSAAGATAAAPTPRAALALLRQAADGLAEAHREDDPLLRYPAAYLAALRAAAAVLAVRAKPRPRRGSTRNAWQLLAEVAPELGEWAAFFASCSDTRAAAEAGIARLVGRREADDLLRQAEQFVRIVGGVVPLR